MTSEVNDKKVAGFSFNQNKVAPAVACVSVPGDRLNAAAFDALVHVRAALI